MPKAHTASKSRSSAGSLGDLSAFRVILDDTLALVKSNQSAAAVTRIRAFELLWDKQANTLNGKDAAKWTVIDGASDVALAAVRSSPASKTRSIGALENLLKLINAG